MAELLLNTGANARIVSTLPDAYFDDDLRVGRTGGGTTQRTLVRFDISALPAAAVVASATLRLWLSEGLSTAPVHAAHRVLAPWIAGEATWNSRATGVAWASPGGDFDAVPSDEPAIPSTVPPGGQYIVWDVAPIVEEVRNAQGSALDCLIKANDEPNQSQRAVYEAFGGDNPPTLLIVYTLPDPEPGISPGAGRFQPDRGQKRPRIGEREPVWVERGYGRFARPRKK